MSLPKEIERKISMLHSEVVKLFMSDVCIDLTPDRINVCISDSLSGIGFEVLEIQYFDLDGNIVDTLEKAKYVRVIANHRETENIRHIFTFAVIGTRNKYKVLYLQSAVQV